MSHGFLIRCKPAGKAFEVDLCPGGLRADADGCSVVVAGQANPAGILEAHLAGKTPESPDVPAAIAVWDGRSGKLELIRDRTGLHPLFHHESSRGTIAGPDARALLALPEVPTEPDPLALAAWLAGVDGEPETTLYRSLRRVPAGHIVTIDARGAHLARLWEPPAEGSLSAREAARFGEALEDSVGTSLIGRAGIFLSGGIDSSAVAAATTKVNRDAGVEPPLALCVEIEGASEESQQRAVAEALGLARKSRPASAGPGLRQRACERAAGSLWPTGSPWQPVYDDLALEARDSGVSQIFDGIGGDELLDAALGPARRAVTHLRFGVMRDIAAAERGYVGGGMLSVLRAAAPRRQRRRWQPPPYIASRYQAALRELADARSDDLLSTRIAAAWEETWDAGLRQGVRYHHPMWAAGVVALVRGLPLEALVARGQAKSPARSYLADRIPAISGPWPRPAVADSLLRAFEREHARQAPAAGALLVELGIVSAPSLGRNPEKMTASMMLLEQWLHSHV